ncbi:MAG: hypothetical protein K2W82_13425 [Candidatus Obscuribacterales bacterium]|nr:hypothetical protein [Candidatus Obscuribacterales bacterium]
MITPQRILPLFFALFLSTLLTNATAADQSLKPSTMQSQTETEVQGPHEVCMDRAKRMRGHYKEYLDRMWNGLKDNTVIPQVGTQLQLKANGVQLDVPPGPLRSKMADSPKSGDQYIMERPVYRPLYAHHGGVPGLFLPPTPSYILDYANKDCKGQGGAVQVGGTPSMPCYFQPQLPPPGQANPQTYNKPGLSKQGDQSIFEYELTTFGVGPMSDTQYQMIEREDNQRFLELLFCPERWNWTAQAATCMQHQQMSDGMAASADQAYNTALDCMNEYLINVANESAAQPCSGNPPDKTKAQAIYMVQQMYKKVFLPMAILLLLPGAVMTQMKGMVQFGVMRTHDDTNDTASPFQGIIRSMVAIFLIPATQLIISYMIDVGNSLTYEVKRYVNFDMLRQYANEQQFDCKIDQSINCMKPAPFNKSADQNSIEGKSYHGAEDKAVAEQQANLSKQVQFMYNFANYAMSSGLIVLATFQLVMICYLFLCGPIAAALYAWPNINKSGNGPGLFNRIFANWLDAVVVLSLWRFWWMVVLATLATYIEWSREMGWFDQHSEWELMIFTSFQVLLMLAPFQPFTFNPRPFVEQIEKQAKEQTGGGQGQGGGGDGKGGGGGGQTAPMSGKSAQSSAPAASTVSNTSTPGESGASGGGSTPSSMPGQSGGESESPATGASPSRISAPMILPSSSMSVAGKSSSATQSPVQQPPMTAPAQVVVAPLPAGPPMQAAPSKDKAGD